MNKIELSALRLAQAANGNPVLTTATVIMFYVMFNFLLASVETLFFGERFEHWLDLVFQAGFIAYAAYAVYMCACFNSVETK